MSQDVTLYQFPLSGNSVKVRMALNYKSISFERINVDPNNRSQVLELSGQPFTPVLVHKNRVVFDSNSILRYLEANFRDTLPIFSQERSAMQAIERWEFWAKSHLIKPFYAVMKQFNAPAAERNPAETQQASQELNELTGLIEEQLEKTACLVGDTLTAADFAVAPLVFGGAVPDEMLSVHPRFEFLQQNYKLGDGRDRTRAWVAKVMAYDR